MKLVKYFKSAKHAEVTTVFNQVVVPNFDEFIQIFQKAAGNFNQVSGYYVQDVVVENCLTTLQEEGRNFQLLTSQSLMVSSRVVSYCSEVINTIQYLSNKKMKRERFLEILNGLLETTNICKRETETLKNGYNKIQNNVCNISDQLKNHERFIQNQKIKISNMEFAAEKKAKNMATDRQKTVDGMGISIGGGLLGCIIGGGYFALAAGAALAAAIYSNDTTSYSEYQAQVELRDQLSSERSKLDDVSDTLRTVIMQTKAIIAVIDIFENFWNQQAFEIGTYIENFERKRKSYSTFKYDKDEAVDVINNWSRVRNQYLNYSNTLSPSNLRRINY